MDRAFIIKEPKSEEVCFVATMIDNENKKNLIFEDEEKSEFICRVIKDNNGEVLAGIFGNINYHLKNIYIDVLWVREDLRNKNLGSKLLKYVEKEAVDNGAEFIHLDTIGFQAKEFYIKNGYHIFGVLDECAQNYKMYQLKKKLDNKFNEILSDNIKIEKGTELDVEYINNQLTKFNNDKLPFLNNPPFVNMPLILKNSKGEILAGILTTMLPYKELIIHGLWADDKLTDKEQLKGILLKALEEEIKLQGGILLIHETFDVKNKKFYESNGYESYGILDDYPGELKGYYMKKVLS